MQKLVAFVVPLVAVLYGLVALRAVGRARTGAGRDASAWLSTAAPILLICYGAVTINNLALARVTFLGSTMLGYGPRYALVDSVSTACLFLAALAWAHAAVSQTRARAVDVAPTASPTLKGDARVIGLQLVGLAVLLVVVGILMEYLRNAHVLPWSAP